jgi:hypothetical protein
MIYDAYFLRVLFVQNKIVAKLLNKFFYGEV